MVVLTNIYQNNGYWHVHTKEHKTEKLCHLVYRTLKGHDLAKGFDIHHIDEDKLNDSPSNLAVLTKKQHVSLHSTQVKWTEQRRAKFIATRKAHPFRHSAETKKVISQKCRESTLKQWAKRKLSHGR